jgi:glycosyltransferase involved in cell wall biosynthesis
VRLLLITVRFPEPHGKGDQVRSFHQLRHLAERHDVTVATPGRASTPKAEAAVHELAHVVPLPGGRASRASSAVRALMRGQPAQVGWMMPNAAWRQLERLALDHVVVLANTVRAVRGPVGRPLVIDHVDALSLNMKRRAGGPESRPVRWFARAESKRLERWERQVAEWAAAQVATSREDASWLPPQPPVDVLPSGYDHPGEVGDGPGERSIDVIFTGSMAYPPNRMAAEWLCSEILPLVRARRPGTSAWIVGRRADTLALDGVEVASDVDDLLDYLRRAKVAVAPLRAGAGTGTPNKVLEAAASGAALVTTSWVTDRFAIEIEAADDAQSIADTVCDLLDDPAARAANVAAALEMVARYKTPTIVERLEQILERAAAAS